MRGKKPFRLSMPPSLGFAAEDPIDRLITDQRLLGGVGIGRLAVIDIAHAGNGRDQLLAMGETGICANASRIGARCRPNARMAA